MTCRNAREGFIDISNEELSQEVSEVSRHLQTCAECRLQYDAWQEVIKSVTPPHSITASNHFRERVMKRIIEEDSREGARSQSYWGRTKWLTAIFAAAILLFLVPTLRIGIKSPAVTLFAQSADAISKVQSVHITGRIRTLPGDNFELIGENYDFVPIEIWREYTNPPRWRVEKPGRVVVMDGKSATMYMSTTNTATSGGPYAGFVEWLRPMLDPQSILQNELDDKSVLSAHLTELNGVTTAVIRRKAQGDFTNNWLQNKSIQESDHTCIYRFDSTSKRLEGLQVNITLRDRAVNIAEFTDFRYNESLTPALFSLQLPENVITSVAPEDMKLAAVTLSGPKDAAAYFFDSLAQERWDDLLAVMPFDRIDDGFKKHGAGLQVISLGKPFQSGLYAGYFVPYQVRLRNGYIKTHNLAVRNDNAAHRWVWDGGF
jgi:outer membrane lipoprotein-sorting protein